MERREPEDVNGEKGRERRPESAVDQCVGGNEDVHREPGRRYDPRGELATAGGDDRAERQTDHGDNRQLVPLKRNRGPDDRRDHQQ